MSKNENRETVNTALFTVKNSQYSTVFRCKGHNLAPEMPLV